MPHPSVRSVATVVLVLAFVLGVAALLWLKNELREERRCNDAWEHRLSEQVRADAPLGSGHARIARWVEENGFELRRAGRGDSHWVAMGFTYCGLGSADRVRIDFDFNLSGRLVSFEVHAGVGEPDGGDERRTPQRPTGVPPDAVWAGGAEGGAWIRCVAEGARNRCSVYNDFTGQLETEGLFVIRGTQAGVPRNELGYNGFDGTSIYLLNGKVLVPAEVPDAGQSPSQKGPKTSE